MNTEEQQYIQGFNHGYLLTKHLPDLVAKLVKQIKETTSHYLSGFFSGKEEYELENTREQLGQLRDIREKGKERGLDLADER
ncbi:MAG: hypothetical protein JWQ38_339 [Flavipsychrobacter sp.]|nr:hypothetical protein [Flavipsychrobacter sp.]